MFDWPPRRSEAQKRPMNQQGNFDLFQWTTEDGQKTIKQIMDTAEQMKRIYKQVSPFLSSFKKK